MYFESMALGKLCVFYCVLLPYELYHQREAKSSTEEEISVFLVSLFVFEEKTVGHCFL